jgi:hypothetical protein
MNITLISLSTGWPLKRAGLNFHCDRASAAFSVNGVTP